MGVKKPLPIHDRFLILRLNRNKYIDHIFRNPWILILNNPVTLQLVSFSVAPGTRTRGCGVKGREETLIKNQ